MSAPKCEFTHPHPDYPCGVRLPSLLIADAANGLNAALLTFLPVIVEANIDPNDVLSLGGVTGWRIEKADDERALGDLARRIVDATPGFAPPAGGDADGE